MTTMMVMLGVIVMVTIGGLGIMSLTSGESMVAGSFVDMRTKENAARSGLRDALARMRERPTNTVAQLQIFLNDSVTTTPHAWYVPVGDSFRLDAAKPSYQALGTDGSGFRVRLLGIDPGGAFGSSGGITIALESNGEGRNHDKQRVVGTYRMRGLDVGSVVITPPAVDSYALYINGSMGNSTIATNVTGNVYVGGNNHLNASVSITIDGNLRTQGNYKTSAPVTVTGNAYVGGFIENSAGGTMTINGDMGVGNGFGNVNAPIVVVGAMNVYGTELQGWNAKADLSVGGQFLMRDRKFQPGGMVTIGGNAYLPYGLDLPSKQIHTVGGNLEINGAVASALAGDSLKVVGNFAARGGNCPTFSAPTRIGGEGYFQMGAGLGSGLRIQKNARFDNGISACSGSPCVRIDSATWLSNGAGQPGLSGYVQLGTTLAMNGTIKADFGKNNGGYSCWRFLTTASPRTWSYQNPTDVTTYSPMIGNSATNNTGGTPSGPWRTSGATFPVVSPWTPWLGMIGLGFNVSDTLVSLIDNRPDTVLFGSSVVSDMYDFSAIKTAAGVTTSLDGASLNRLFNWFQTSGKLHNGYMIVRMNEAVSMSMDNVRFNGKCLLIFDANLTTNMGWPASVNSSAIQVLIVRNGDLGNNFGSPGPFYGYIHYMSQWSGNHKWPTGSQMFGALYLAGASSSVIGNGSDLNLVRDQDVIDNIQDKLGILYPNGSVNATTGSTNSKQLTLRETWIQFDRISEMR